MNLLATSAALALLPAKAQTSPQPALELPLEILLGRR
jgi:hypothetical protein